MAVLCFMTRRRINLVRLILDFTLAAINTKRRRHATLPDGMFFPKVFIRAQLPLDGHKADNKRPMTTMKTLSAFGLTPEPQEKEKKKDKKKKDSAIAAKVSSAKKGKPKPSEEGKKKKKRKEKKGASHQF